MTNGPDTRLVTVSATYGVGGSVIAPRLAERLGLPFADRLLPAADVARQTRTSENLTDEERDQTAKAGLLTRLAYITSGLSMPVPLPIDVGEGLREQVEASIRQLVGAGGAVLLGRAGSVVLAGHPTAFHVRLDGPEERRVARAMAIEHIDEKTARNRLNETDRARSRYVHRLYGRDISDPLAYHLLLDSTVLEVNDSVSVIATAAEAFWRRVHRPTV
jgi:cytidylate kinase